MADPCDDSVVNTLTKKLTADPRLRGVSTPVLWATTAALLEILADALPEDVEICEACGKIEDTDIGVKNPDDGVYLCGSCVDSVIEDEADARR